MLFKYYDKAQLKSILFAGATGSFLKDFSPLLSSELQNEPVQANNTEDDNASFHPWTQDYNDYIDFTSTFNVSIIILIFFKLMEMVLIVA